MAPLALGTDGGGSIRIPCGFTGLAGLKPSHGRVPAYPASAFGMLRSGEVFDIARLAPPQTKVQKKPETKPAA